MAELTPRQTVEELDKYIIGQGKACRCHCAAKPVSQKLTARRGGRGDHAQKYHDDGADGRRENRDCP